jgi:hypothetical protein
VDNVENIFSFNHARFVEKWFVGILVGLFLEVAHPQVTDQSFCVRFRDEATLVSGQRQNVSGFQGQQLVGRTWSDVDLELFTGQTYLTISIQRKCFNL